MTELTFEEMERLEGEWRALWGTLGCTALGLVVGRFISPTAGLLTGIICGAEALY